MYTTYINILCIYSQIPKTWRILILEKIATVEFIASIIVRDFTKNELKVFTEE